MLVIVIEIQDVYSEELEYNEHLEFYQNFKS